MPTVLSKVIFKLNNVLSNPRKAKTEKNEKKNTNGPPIKSQVFLSKAGSSYEEMMTVADCVETCKR